MSVSSIGPQTNPQQTQNASASAKNAGADDETTKPGQASGNKADADDGKAVNNNALSTSSSSVQAALQNLQPGGAYPT